MAISIVIMGVSGSGKTQVGKALSAITGWLFLDGDDFHSAANVAKMSGGEPLDEADRLPWLDTLGALITETIDRDENIILACSALKQSYRDRLNNTRSPQIQFVYLKVPLALLQERLNQRHDHFMKSQMLPSQLETLEEPHPSTATIVCGRSDLTPTAIALDIYHRLEINS
jgi:gluconokinase